MEPEHLLLGLLRESHLVAKWFTGESNAGAKIRAEVEAQIKKGEQIRTLVNLPISAQFQKVLELAASSSEKLSHPSVDAEHILIGLLQLETSLASKILIAHAFAPGPIEEQIAKAPSWHDESSASELKAGAMTTLESFLAGLTLFSSKELLLFFAKNAEFIDASGRLWTYEELSQDFGILFAPYAKKNAGYLVETTLEMNGMFLAVLLWANVFPASGQRAWKQRMTVVLMSNKDGWEILSAQATPVQTV
jgi:hypothetical protein